MSLSAGRKLRKDREREKGGRVVGTSLKRGLKDDTAPKGGVLIINLDS